MTTMKEKKSKPGAVVFTELPAPRGVDPDTWALVQRRGVVVQVTLDDMLDVDFGICRLVAGSEHFTLREESTDENTEDPDGTEDWPEGC